MIDSTGREWIFKLNFSILRDVETTADVNLLDVQSLGKIAESVDTFANVAWAFCRGQAESKQIDRESFEAGLDGDDIDKISKEVVDAIVNFSRNSPRAKILKMARDVSEKQEAEALARISDLGDGVTSGQLQGNAESMTFGG